MSRHFEPWFFPVRAVWIRRLLGCAVEVFSVPRLFSSVEPVLLFSELETDRCDRALAFPTDVRFFFEFAAAAETFFGLGEFVREFFVFITSIGKANNLVRNSFQPWRPACREKQPEQSGGISFSGSDPPEVRWGQN